MITEKEASEILGFTTHESVLHLKERIKGKVQYVNESIEALRKIEEEESRLKKAKEVLSNSISKDNVLIAYYKRQLKEYEQTGIHSI